MDAAVDRTPRRVCVECSLNGVCLHVGVNLEAIGHVDPLEDEHAVVEFYLSDGYRIESPAAGGSGLQRTAEGTGQSSGSGCDAVVERR